MNITPSLIGRCIRPQFIWDSKASNIWLLCNDLRYLKKANFCKELGILTFLNVGRHYNIRVFEVRDFLGLTDAQAKTYNEQLDRILQEDGWEIKVLLVKTGLVKNLITYNINFS